MARPRRRRRRLSPSWWPSPQASVSRTGEAVDLKVTAYDAAGKPIPDAFVRVNVPRGAGAYADGKLTGFRAGTFTATAVAAGAAGAPPVTLEIPVTVAWPPLAKLEIADRARPALHRRDARASRRGLARRRQRTRRSSPTWRSSDPAVATVDRFGNVTALKPGAVTITADGRRRSATKALHGRRESGRVDRPRRSRRARSAPATSIQLAGTAKRADGQPVERRADHLELHLHRPRTTPIKAPGGAGHHRQRAVRRELSGPLHDSRVHGRGQRAQGRSR